MRGLRSSRIVVVFICLFITGGLSAQSACPPYPETQTAADGSPLDTVENYADRAIQCRLDEGEDVQLPSGTWVIGNELVVTRPGTTLSGQGIGAGGTVLYASPGLEGSLVQVVANDVTIRDIYFNANRDRRAYVSDCARNQDIHYVGNQPDTNSVSAGDVTNFTFINNRIDYTMCGTAMPLFGTQYTIKDNIIAFNGFGQGDRRANNGSWADGLSLGCHGLQQANGTVIPCMISGNTIIDATDVPIAIFNPDHNVLENNRMVNLSAFAFGATGLPYKLSQDGNGNIFRERVGPGMKYLNNMIISAHGLQSVGVTIGGAAYDCGHRPSLLTSGLTVDRNGNFLPDGQAPDPADVAEYNGNRSWGAQIGLGAMHIENMKIVNNTAERCVTQAAVDEASAGLPADLRSLMQAAVGTCADDPILPGEPRGKSIQYAWDKEYDRAQSPDPHVQWNNPGPWQRIDCVNANQPQRFEQRSCPSPTFNGQAPGSTIRLDVPASGGVATFPTTHGVNCGWVTRRQQGDPAAIELRSHGVGGGGTSILTPPTTGRFVAQVKANTTGQSRTFVYELVTRNNIRTRVEIRQCSVGVVSQSQLTLSPLGGSATVNLTIGAGCSWTATVADASGAIPDWVTVTPSQGSGNATLTINAKKNESLTRSAIISVAGTTITLTQPEMCPHQLLPQLEVFTSAATSGQVFVNSNNCTWIARPLQPWIHLDGAGADGTVTATGARWLRFTIDLNPTTQPRTGEIQVGVLTYVFNQKGQLNPDSCVRIVAFDGTMGLISGTQKTVLNVVAENAASYEWFNAANPGQVIGTDYQLILEDNPGATITVTRQYYVDVYGKGECGSARSDTASVTIQGVGLTDTFNIKTDPPSRIDSIPGFEIPISVEIENWDPNNGGPPGTFPVEFDWFEGLTGDESSPAGVTRQEDSPYGSTIWVRPFGNTSYWCRVKVTSRRRTSFLLSGTARIFMPTPPKRRVVRHDYNYDGESDLLWRNNETGEVRAWLMNDRTHTSNMNFGAAPLSYELQSVGDLTGDLRPDFVFRDPDTGANSVWAMNYNQGVSMPLPPNPGADWSIGAVADMDGDEAQDLVWYNRLTGEARAWLMNGVTPVGSWSFGSTPGEAWRLQGVADFDLNESPDLVFRNYQTGENVAWLMDDLTVSAKFRISTAAVDAAVGTNALVTGRAITTLPDTNWRPASFDDFTNDGRPDIFWFNSATGQTQVWWMAETLRSHSTPQETESDPAWQIAGHGDGPQRVAAAETTLNVTAAPAAFGGSTTLVAVLAATGADIGGKTIAFTIDGVAAGHATTDAGGNAALAVSLGAYSAGTHGVTASFAGDAGLQASSAAAALTIDKATPVIHWTTPDAIVYGTALSAVQLNATASVPGTFAYQPAAGTIPAAGTHTLRATFTPSNPTNYTTATAEVTLHVEATPVTINWAAPAAIHYGTPLSAAQLNASASVLGTFAYDPPAGTVLGAGLHPLDVTFTPSDPNYAVTQKTVTIAVNRATPSLTWAAPAPIVYGSPLSGVQLNATANAGGSFVYTPAAGTLLNAGTHTLQVAFTPSDAANYTTATASVTLTVHKATPVISWAAPAAITYGTPLSGAQLNATANVSGSFAYDPPAGTLLNAGTRTLAAAFTPSDTANYTTATASVALLVNKATPAIAWATPAAIVYGTPLSGAQLNATANVSGSFAYDPPTSTLLNAGTRTLAATFTPSDTANYTTATASVALLVNKATPAIAWAIPAAIIYGTPLSGAQLNATADVSGSFAYDPPADTVLHAGTRRLAATFTPSDTANYTTATASVTLLVHKATPAITWMTPAAIVYGTPLSGAQLNATANVAGTFTYDPAAGTILQAGNRVLSAAFVPSDRANYNDASATVTLTVQKATPVLTWSTPAPITYGTALSSTQLNAAADVPGAFVYTPAAGTILDAGTRTLATHFTPSDVHNYNEAEAQVSLMIDKASQTLEWAPPPPIVYGTVLSSTQLNATVTVVGPSPAGTLSYVPAAGTTLDAGQGQPLTVQAAETANYLAATLTVGLDVLRAPLSVVAAPVPKLYGAPVPALTGTITGVRNHDDITPIFTTTGTMSSPAGTYPIEASLRDPNGRLRNYDVTLTNSTLTVLRAPLAIRVNDSAKQYSDPLPVFTVTFTGFVLGETPSVLGGTVAFSTNAAELSNTGAYTVSAAGLMSANYDVTWIPGTLTVTPEDARLTYAGSRLVNGTKLLLGTTIADVSASPDAAGDVTPGDIRTATVTFVNRATGAALCTAPVVPLDASDPRAGTVTCVATIDPTGLASITVGTRVAGNYQRDAAADDVVVTVVAASDNFLTGGGWIQVSESSGTLPADSGSKLNVVASAKYKANKGVTAGVTIELQSGSRRIRITATTVLDAVVLHQAGGGVAELVATTKVEDVTRSATVIDSGTTMLLSIADNGEPGSNDTITVTVWSSDGTLLLASRWDGRRAVPQLLDGGNLQIH